MFTQPKNTGFLIDGFQCKLPWKSLPKRPKTFLVHLVSVTFPWKLSQKAVRGTVSVIIDLTHHHPRTTDKPELDCVCSQAMKRAGGWLGDFGGSSHAGDVRLVCFYMS